MSRVWFGLSGILVMLVAGLAAAGFRGEGLAWPALFPVGYLSGVAVAEATGVRKDAWIWRTSKLMAAVAAIGAAIGASGVLSMTALAALLGGLGVAGAVIAAAGDDPAAAGGNGGQG